MLRQGKGCATTYPGHARPNETKSGASSPSRTRGGSSARVIVPNAVLPKLVLGAASGGVLVTLNASARNSSRTLSVIGNVLPNITSSVWYPGPTTGLRDALPSVNCPAWANAAVLNHRPVVRSSAGSSGIADAIWPLNSKSREGVEVGRLRDCKRASGLKRERCRPTANLRRWCSAIHSSPNACPGQQEVSQTKDPENT